jgi:hypothetical protein
MRRSNPQQYSMTIETKYCAQLTSRGVLNSKCMTSAKFARKSMTEVLCTSPFHTCIAELRQL